MEKTDREFSSILPILQEIKKNKVQVIFGVLPLELTWEIGRATLFYYVDDGSPFLSWRLADFEQCLCVLWFWVCFVDICFWGLFYCELRGSCVCIWLCLFSGLGVGVDPGLSGHS